MAKNLIAAWPKAYLAGLAVLVLAACSPRYDWREVRSEQSGWVALFPDKPQTQTRTMNLDGRSLDMTMTIARVNEVSFVVGHVTEKNGEQDTSKLREAKPGLREILRDAMLRNIQGVKQSEQAALISRTTQGVTPLPALAVEAYGQVSGKAVHLSARFAGYGTDTKQEAIQMLVLGPQDLMSRPAGQQAVETFFTSLKVE